MFMLIPTQQNHGEPSISLLTKLGKIVALAFPRVPIQLGGFNRFMFLQLLLGILLYYHLFLCMIDWFDRLLYYIPWFVLLLISRYHLMSGIVLADLLLEFFGLFVFCFSLFFDLIEWIVEIAGVYVLQLWIIPLMLKMD